MRTRTLSMALGLLTSLVFSSGASALPINPSNSGLSMGTGSSAPGFGILYALDSSGAVTGDLDIAAGVLTFAIDLAGADFSATPSDDDGVTGLTFSGVSYSGSVPVSTSGTTHTIDLGQTAQITGTLTAIGAGGVTSIAANSALVTGVCSGTPGASLGCNLIFGPQLFSADVNGKTRYFNHTIDAAAAAVPEPGVAMLLGLGLIGLGAARPPRV